MEHLWSLLEPRLLLQFDWCLKTLSSHSDWLWKWAEPSCCGAATWAAAAAGSEPMRGGTVAAGCVCWRVGWSGGTASPERTLAGTVGRTGCRGRGWGRSSGRRRRRPPGGAWRFSAGRMGSSQTWTRWPSWNERSGWGASTPSKIQQWDLEREKIIIQQKNFLLNLLSFQTKFDPFLSWVFWWGLRLTYPNIYETQKITSVTIRSFCCLQFRNLFDSRCNFYTETVWMRLNFQLLALFPLLLRKGGNHSNQ